ncbi:MAG: maltose alpha-D-glucosyltransferase [Phycisphaerales bacterium]
MNNRMLHSSLSDDPLWYKDAIIYQLHVRSFYDSNGDGIGDFQGLSQKLDYLEDLGVNAIWLLPFYPSPLKDDGYDISDYTDIHPIYGSMEDFTSFLKKAHNRGIRVITELVINHTSDQHPWFQLARRSPKGSKLRNYYVWSDTPEKYKGVRIIFKDFESSNWTYDTAGHSYFWHRFYSHQPDLNYESPQVLKEVLRFLDLWMEKGVDGLRLDAIPYLYEQEGTSCENLPQTHVFLKKLRAHIERKYKNRMLLAEANQWPEQVVAYFGNDDECNMALHFPIMPRLFMAIRMENHYPIMEILNQTPAIPEKCQWAMFLRNHDELTLEMVTDKDRDYMYQVYARDRAMRINLGIRRRLAPLLENDRRQIELMNCLLFSMPGTPIVYYGDEIGMGDNVFLGDRNGIRTPMQWSADRNAGFSKANPQRLFLPVTLDPVYHYESVNVENQQGNQNSLLWWMKHLINLRKKFKAFSRGSIKFLTVKNPKILAFIRQYENEKILVMANLADSVQYAELDLSEYTDMVPMELFGQTQLPIIAKNPYLFTFGAYGFYWLQLAAKPHEIIQMETKRQIASFRLEGAWEDIVEDKNRHNFERILSEYVKHCNWFAGRDRKIERTEIIDYFRVPDAKSPFYLLLFEIEYTNGYMEKYFLPIGLISEADVENVQKETDPVIAAKIVSSKIDKGLIYDALYDEKFLKAYFNFISRRRDQRGRREKLIIKKINKLKIGDKPKIFVKDIKCQTLFIDFDDKYQLKIYRRLESGTTPEIEVSSYLTNKKFAHIMPLCASLEYSVYNEENTAISIIYDYVENQGSSWKYTINYLLKNYEEAAKQSLHLKNIPPVSGSFYDLLHAQPPDFVQEFFQIYLDQINLLAHRTAQMHTALSSDPEDPVFKPETFTDFRKFSKYHSIYSLVRETMRQLDNCMSQFPEKMQMKAKLIMNSEKEILSLFKSIRDRNISGMRIRVHGDYNLRNVLYAGKDFIITNFEGRSSQSLSERKNKTSPLFDVACMLRSLHYASYVSVFNIPQGGFPLAPVDIEPIQNLWYTWVSATFVSNYLKYIKDSPLIPKNEEEIKLLLDGYLLERTFSELLFEINHQSDWIRVPFEEIMKIISRATKNV